MNTVASFMLLFNFTLAMPDGEVREEIVDVYSKHFESQKECTDFLESWEGIIKSRGVSTLQDMLKDGYKVNLNVVKCEPVPSFAPLPVDEKAEDDKFDDDDNHQAHG